MASNHKFNKFQQKNLLQSSTPRENATPSWQSKAMFICLHMVSVRGRQFWCFYNHFELHLFYTNYHHFFRQRDNLFLERLDPEQEVLCPKRSGADLVRALVQESFTGEDLCLYWTGAPDRSLHAG